MGMCGEEHLETITDVATETAAERGYYGMTIQEVSGRVGITQARLLKYIKNKNGLLMLVLRRYEDSGEAGDYIQSKLALTPEQWELSPLLTPGYYRTIAEDIMKCLQLTWLYLVLCAETIDPNHPAYEYYAQRGGRLCAQIGSYPWRLPPKYNTPQKIGSLSVCVDSVMESLQSRWLGESSIDFTSSRSQYENILFPHPHWNDHR